MDHRARSWLAAASLATVVCGCAGEQEALIVLHTPAFEQGECAAVPDSSVSVQRGILDLSYGTGYTLPVVLMNNLGSRPRTSSSSGVENGELQLRDVDVRLSMPQAPEVISQLRAENAAFVEFSAPLASISLPPNTETGVVVDVIPQMVSSSLRQAILDNLDETQRPTLVAEIVFHATRTGNSAGNVGVIDSRAYQFPIEVCAACLPRTCETCPDEQCPPNAHFASVCGNAQDGILSPLECDPLDR